MATEFTTQDLFTIIGKKDVEIQLLRSDKTKLEQQLANLYSIMEQTMTQGNPEVSIASLVGETAEAPVDDNPPTDAIPQEDEGE